MADSGATMAPRKLRVKQIYTYPIKSLRGISLSAMPATYMGFPHDRRFMLFNVAQGKNMAVAHFTEMCLFTTAFAADGGPEAKVIVTYTKNHVFDHPDKKVSPDPLQVPLSPATAGLEEIEITMHSSPCIGYDMGESYNRWFSERFGYQVKLLYIGGNRRKVLGNMPPNVAAQQRDSAARESNGRSNGNSWLGSITSTATSLARTIAGAGGFDVDKENQYDGIDEGISFADVAPYLVISTKSWENAQRRLPENEEMDISKFRPNIIVEGAEEEFEEDYWAELLIGGGPDYDENKGVKIILTQNCARCNSLNVDYATGKVGEGESGKILKKLQSDRRVDPGAKWSPVFGRYGFLARVPEGKSAAEIKVGDEVSIVKRNKERTRFEWPNLSTN